VPSSLFGTADKSAKARINCGPLQSDYAVPRPDGIVALRYPQNTEISSESHAVDLTKAPTSFAASRYYPRSAERFGNHLQCPACILWNLAN
jgi:hypothetical protein